MRTGCRLQDALSWLDRPQHYDVRRRLGRSVRRRFPPPCWLRTQHAHAARSLSRCGPGGRHTGVHAQESHRQGARAAISGAPIYRAAPSVRFGNGTATRRCRATCNVHLSHDIQHAPVAQGARNATYSRYGFRYCGYVVSLFEHDLNVSVEGPGADVGAVLAQLWTRPGADVGAGCGRVPAQMWTSPGADVDESWCRCGVQPPKRTCKLAWPWP